MSRPDAILIAGPTASGKSNLGLELAKRFDGEIVNTDSMQIYPVLRVLTARPDDHDLTICPHHLYGYAPISEAYSVARWLEDAKEAAEDIWARGKLPIFVGGTGLYFKALEEGIAFVPEIPTEVRTHVREELVRDGSEALYDRLMELDAEAAMRLRPSDGHRVARALEVVLATGKSLLYFQSQPYSPSLLADKQCNRMVIMPERSILHERINMRTEKMIELGATKEVEELMSLNLPKSATILKAIGVSQLHRNLAGEIDVETTVNLIKAATRQYSKRQSTWFRGQFDNNWKFNPSVDTFF